MNPYRAAPPPTPAPWLPRALAVLCALVSSPALVLLAACASMPKLTPEAAKNIEGAAAAICMLEGAIPEVGEELVLSCPVQMAAFDRWIDSETAPGVPQRVQVRLRRGRRDAGAEGGR